MDGAGKVDELGEGLVRVSGWGWVSYGLGEWVS